MNNPNATTVEMIDLKLPSMFKVVIHDNDTTPIDLVVFALVHAAELTDEQAFNLALEAHNQGSAVVGTYTKSVADEVITNCNDIAAQNGHPEFKATKEEDT